VPESAFTGSDAAALPEADVVETTVGGEDSASAPLTAADRPAAIVFVLGGPGSGKGTQCARIAEGFGYTHLSTGDLLRAEVAAGTPTGKEAEALMKEGNLVPTRIVLALLKKAVVKQRGGKFLIDGYPRTLDQAFEFERMIGAPTFVLAYGADDDVLTQRLLERGKTSGRADDNEDTIRQRLRTFHQESAPVIDFYGKLGLVRSVPSVGSPDEVFAATAPHFHPEVIFVLGGPGSGKGTQCARIADAYGYTHLSTGDLLRAEVASGSKRGQSIADIMRVGDLVPVEVTMEVLGDAIRANPSGRFLVDGFPRTVEQAQLFEASVGPVHRVLVLDVEAAECRRRALSRASVEHRADDTHAGISGQLRVWKNATQGVVSLYESLGLVHHVDGSGTPDQVWGRVQRLFSRHVTFVLGGPGSGKGTQCARLVSEFGFVHLSAGDLLRAEVARGSPDGAMIQSYIAEGKIVPVAVTLALLRAAMDAASMGSANGRNTRFLVDGFPRAADQAAAYEASLGAPDGVLFFDLSEAAMRERLLERGKTSGRADDNEDTIVKRFETFRDTSLPVIHSYARRGLVTRVDASGDIDAVYASTRSGFASRVVFVVGDEGRAGAVVQHLVDTQGAVHLDVGAMVAAEAKRGTPVGAAIRERGADAGARLAVLRQGQQGVGDGLAVVTGFGPEEGDVEAYTSSAGVSEPEAVLFLSATGGAVPAYASALAGSRGATVVRTDGTDESSMLKAASAPFQPELVVLVGASGSGRGEFSMRASLQMGYATLRMTHILRDAAAAGGADGHAIGEALALKRTTPLGPTLRALRKAMLAFPRTRRFILDGFPRQVSAGFPSVHDQVFALEESFGPLRGAISLDARLAVRRARCIPGNPTVGEEAALVASVDAYEREKLPVLRFFESYRMARSVDTGAGADSTPDAVFESARGILDGGARDPLGFQPPLPPPEEKPAEVGEEDPDDF
jgi:adenylate kinase